LLIQPLPELACQSAAKKISVRLEVKSVLNTSTVTTKTHTPKLFYKPACKGIV